MKPASDYRDTLYTVDSGGNRRWVYVHRIAGRFLTARRVVAYVLMAVYLLLPWIAVNGRQGLRIDVPRGRVSFFGAELWATDTIFLFLVLASLGMALFLFTALFGRIWCGWACPETVFLEFLFRPIERLIEGSDAERRRRDAAPWSASKLFRKGVKHGVSAACAWVIASTALAYFIGREPLLDMVRHSPVHHPEMFMLTLALMALMAFQFGWFREQFCTVLCPYARFQSVLMDPNSLLVGYDRTRGEPRGKLRAVGAGRGDCVDCGLCVRVCPTGIDIRNGTQLECVACTACVDACDSVMTKIGKPRGLVRYTTEARLNGEPGTVLRPRLVAYGGLLTVALGAIVFFAQTRSLIDLEITRHAGGSPATINEADVVTNQFALRVANKGSAPVRFEALTVSDSRVTAYSPLTQFELKSGAATEVPLFLRADAAVFAQGRITVELAALTSDKLRIVRSVILVGPIR